MLFFFFFLVWCWLHQDRS